MTTALNAPRLVAVLGYSNGAVGELHAICAARLRQAERLARPDDIVLLSGWARGRRKASEAELMARAWRGEARRIVLDRRPRSTIGNVQGVAELARRSGVREVLLVTSSWHAPRASALLRASLRGSAAAVTVSATDERPSVRERARELACWVVAPLALLGARVRRL